MAIKKELIKKGDIIAWKATARSSILAKLIGFFQVITGQQGSYHRTYSHVAIAENQEYCLEMTWPKSRRRKIKPNESEIELHRVKRAEEIIYISDMNDKVKYWFMGISRTSRAEIAITACRRRLGEWYDLVPLLTLGIVGTTKECSPWLAEAWLDAGIVLSIEGKSDKLVSPNEIVDSKEVYKVN